MGDVLIQFIPLALAAIAPGMIIATLVFLGTQNGLVKAAAFTLGKYVVYIGWGILFMLFSDWIATTEGFEAPTFPVLKVILGILLLVLAFRNLFKDSDPEESSTPKWMSSLENASSPAVFGIGALLSLVQIQSTTEMLFLHSNSSHHSTLVSNSILQSS